MPTDRGRVPGPLSDERPDDGQIEADGARERQNGGRSSDPHGLLRSDVTEGIWRESITRTIIWPFVFLAKGPGR